MAKDVKKTQKKNVVNEEKNKQPKKEVVKTKKVIEHEDIETKEVTEHLDWKLMDRLIEDVCYGMLNEYDENHLRMRYEDYKGRFM